MMKLTLTCDDSGLERLPDATGFIIDYIGQVLPKGKAGRSNGTLIVRQHDDAAGNKMQWTFEIWHTAAGVLMEINTKPFTFIQDDNPIS